MEYYDILLIILQIVFSGVLFWLGGFANAWPGMALQLVLVPLVVTALKRAKFIPIAA